MVWGQNKNQHYGGGGGGSGSNMGMGGMQGMGNYQGGGRGILGESPGGNMGMGGYGGIQGLGGMGQGILGNSGNDNIDSMIQQRRLQQQLSIRESQLALASNLLQKQSQLIMDVGLPGSGGGGGNMGPMLSNPNPMSRPMIPSLLDMPAHPRQGKRPGPMGRDMDFKRRRRDLSPSDQRGRNSDFDRRPRDRDHFSPNRRRDEPPSRRDRPSRFSRRDSGETRRRSRKNSEEYDPANPTGDGEEMPGLELAEETIDDRRQNFRSHMTSSRHKGRMSEVLNMHENKSTQIQARMKATEHLKRIEKTGVRFCKLCDQDLNIPFMRHKTTTLHKKREMQVHKGCGWCGVKNFLNFTQVLKHREKESHKQNAAKFGKKAGDGKDDNRDRDRGRDRDRDSKDRNNQSRTSSRSPKDLVTVDSKSKSSSRTPSKSSKEEDPMPELKFNADVAVGQNYVIPVSGFFCKLCHKFYNTETAAKVTHCQSQSHFNVFKQAKIAAKAKAMAQKARPSSTSTPISDKNKQTEDSGDADNTLAEMKKEEEKEQMEEDQKQLEEEDNKIEEDNQNKNKSSDKTEAEEEEAAMEVGDAEEKQGQGQKETDEPASNEDDKDANGVAIEEEEEDQPLTEEEQEEKLLERGANEGDDILGDDVMLDDLDGDDSVAIVDLTEGMETPEDAKEEAEMSEPADQSVPEQEAEEDSGETTAEAEELESIEASQPAPRGRGRGRGRRGKRGKK